MTISFNLQKGVIAFNLQKGQSCANFHEEISFSFKTVRWQQDKRKIISRTYGF